MSNTLRYLDTQYLYLCPSNTGVIYIKICVFRYVLLNKQHFCGWNLFISSLSLLQALVKLGFSLDSPAFYTLCEVHLFFCHLFLIIEGMHSDDDSYEPGHGIMQTDSRNPLILFSCAWKTHFVKVNLLRKYLVSLFIVCSNVGRQRPCNNNVMFLGSYWSDQKIEIWEFHWILSMLPHSAKSRKYPIFCILKFDLITQ